MTNALELALLNRLSQVAEQKDAAWPDEDTAIAAAKLAGELSLSFSHGGARPAIGDVEIAAYLDNRLSEEEREAFEASLLASPELRDEVDAMSHQLMAIDETLPLPAGLVHPIVDVVGQATVEGLRANFVQGTPLSVEQQRALFTDLVLRSEYNRLIRTERLNPPPQAESGPFSAHRSMPSRIAASSDRELKYREFPGGSIHIGSAGRPNLVQLRIKLESPNTLGDILQLTGPDGAMAYLTLPTPDSEGEITKVVDLKNEQDAMAIELLRDPLTVGRFGSLSPGAPQSPTS